MPARPLESDRPRRSAQTRIRRTSSHRAFAEKPVAHSAVGDREAIASRPVAFRPDASYLVTGGLGGLGLEVARWMAAQGATRSGAKTAKTPL